jgi:hypothetical protein
MNGSGHVAWNICSMQKMVPLSLSLSLSRDDTLEGQMVLQSVMLIIHPNLNKEMIKESYN